MAYQQQAPMQQQFAPGPNVTEQEWGNGLCSCGPCDLCLVGTFLPCLLLGKTSERLRDPTMASYEPLNTDCMLHCGINYLTGCGWIWVMMKRGEIRERYGIKGSGMDDCCASYWCSCCSLIQQEKEVIARTSAGPITAGYQPQKDGMQMPH
jgi:Cys-rich protein (TIGR01571 family)